MAFSCPVAENSVSCVWSGFLVESDRESPRVAHPRWLEAEGLTVFYNLWSLASFLCALQCGS